ncbi:jg4180 [Pararge aegeria aegeria]|uniref:Jg4180 protein n=1 Tax=Pararge aegeria aegeria TaxID=348720 RepID=A0A8S4SDS6_9NEOP|nr:jg4180 [Pararge aegeria aegeria]
MLSLMSLRLRRQARPSDRNTVLLLGGRNKQGGSTSPDEHCHKKRFTVATCNVRVGCDSRVAPVCGDSLGGAARPAPLPCDVFTSLPSLSSF